MSLLPWFKTILLGVLALLAVVWLVRHSRRGWDWVLAAVPLAFGASYLSSWLFRVPDYQAGCEVLCPGWWGYPIATHVSNVVASAAAMVTLQPSGLVLNAGYYYAYLMSGSAAVAWLADSLHWRERRRGWRFGFLLVAILLPLAMLPSWVPPPTPHLPAAERRLAINAERAWFWQLQAHRLTDRRLAVEDVRQHPDGQRHRVCFRVYTWFYIAYRQAYVDLEPAGVRATGGGTLPLNASCWIQP